jgi:glycosyltransferase involved in cell wall biosynthesis
MHIAWINESAFNLGGAERYVRETAAHLRERGVRSTLLYDVKSRVDPGYLASFDGAFPQVDVARQIRELAPDAIYVHRIAEEGDASLIASSGVPTLRFFHDHKLFCLREHKYTAIGQTTCTDTVGLNCYTCLGFVQRSAEFPSVKLVSVASLARAQRANRALTAFVVGSKYMGDHIEAHGFSRSKIHVLPLYTSGGRAEAAAKSGAEREPGLVLFVGQLIRGKGVDILLRALADVLRRGTDVRLLIVGQGRQEEELRALSSELGLDARVTFAGKIAPTELSSYYARADFLVQPSRIPETFGLTGLEALAAGVPVIASDSGGVREWLEDGRNGIAVPSCDVPALSAAITRLATDRELRDRLAARAPETHRERFLPDHHVSRLHALFERFTARKEAA